MATFRNDDGTLLALTALGALGAAGWWSQRRGGLNRGTPNFDLFAAIRQQSGGGEPARQQPQVSVQQQIAEQQTWTPPPPRKRETSWRRSSVPGARMRLGSRSTSPGRFEPGHWISEAIKRPGRVRAYLGIPEGQLIPISKLQAAIRTVKADYERTKDPDTLSLLRALTLARTLKQGFGKGRKRKAA